MAPSSFRSAIMARDESFGKDDDIKFRNLAIGSLAASLCLLFLIYIFSSLIHRRRMINALAEFREISDNDQVHISRLNRIIERHRATCVCVARGLTFENYGGPQDGNDGSQAGDAPQGGAVRTTSSGVQYSEFRVATIPEDPAENVPEQMEVAGRSEDRPRQLSTQSQTELKELNRNRERYLNTRTQSPVADPRLVVGDDESPPASPILDRHAAAPQRKSSERSRSRLSSEVTRDDVGAAPKAGRSVTTAQKSPSASRVLA